MSPIVLPRRNRRLFFADIGMGLAGIAAADLSASEQSNANEIDAANNSSARAKSVIWIFLIGGMSHMESFDPKPALNEHAGKTIAESPFSSTLDSPYVKKNLREFVEGLHKVQPKLYPLQVEFKKYGQSGLEFSDWWSNLGQHCADDLAIVRSMWTTDNDHGAQLQFHTGRHALEGRFPTIGSWVHYGLGVEARDLPSYCVLGTPLADCCGGIGGHGADYLGPIHAGVPISTDPNQPLPYAKPPAGRTQALQKAEFDFLHKLNQLSSIDYPDDESLRARIRSYELAFKMQSAAPEAVSLKEETESTISMYGANTEPTKTFGEQCLVARRLVERGVRFVQIFHGSNGGAGAWDAHSNLKSGHTALCQQVDLPISGLIRDLKQRGMLDETIVVIATEFGRTPGAEQSNGRDHHPYGFSIALAGGGIKGGIVHGATDEIGFHAVEDRHYVTDLHATILHQLGVNHRSLEIPGHKRIDLDFGEPIKAILT